MAFVATRDSAKKSEATAVIAAKALSYGRRDVAVFSNRFVRCQAAEMGRPTTLKVSLWIRQFPKPAIVRITVKSVPAAGISPKFPEVRVDEFFDSFARVVGNNPPIARRPSSGQHCLIRCDSHFTFLITAPAGIGWFGITNSRAPPAVRPPPMNPGSVLKTGDAIPD